MGHVEELNRLVDEALQRAADRVVHSLQDCTNLTPDRAASIRRAVCNRSSNDRAVFETFLRRVAALQRLYVLRHKPTGELLGASAVRKDMEELHKRILWVPRALSSGTFALEADDLEVVLLEVTVG